MWVNLLPDALWQYLAVNEAWLAGHGSASGAETGYGRLVHEYDKLNVNEI